jgi:hypothetical protein
LLCPCQPLRAQAVALRLRYAQGVFRTLLAAGTVVAVVAISGCGSAVAPPPTLAQFAREANQICAQLSSEQEPFAARLEALDRIPGANSGQVAAAWRGLESVSHAADVKVGELPRPPAQADVIRQLVAGYFEEASNELDLANAFASQDAIAIEAAQQIYIRLAISHATVARRLGMTDCAKAEESGPSTIAAGAAT